MDGQWAPIGFGCLRKGAWAMVRGQAGGVGARRRRAAYRRAAFSRVGVGCTLLVAAYALSAQIEGTVPAVPGAREAAGQLLASYLLAYWVQVAARWASSISRARSAGRVRRRGVDT